MTQPYSIHPKYFNELEQGVQTFHFLKVKHQLRIVTVVIARVNNAERHDQLIIEVEPVFQSELDFPKDIVIQTTERNQLHPSYLAEPVSNPADISGLMRVYFENQLNATTNKRDKALLSGFISTIPSIQKAIISR